MSEPDDHELLAQYAQGPPENSEAAFNALAERYINLVYSTALRSIGNDHAAQEIVQAVFIILANKAGKFSRRIVLSGWLYQTTRLTAANFLRGEIRRQQREQEAFMQSTLQEPADDLAWRQIAPLLDDALAKLGERDRNAIVLRFFENKNLHEVGLALGASEDAAKMRVNRALEKLRKIFGKRGAVFSTVAIAGVVSANSVHAAPLGLAKTVSALALTKGVTAGGSTLALVKGALKLMAWSKMQMAVIVGAVVLLAAGTATVTVREIQEHRKYPWEVPHVDATVFYAASAQVIIVPTKFAADGDSMGDSGRGVIGIAQPLDRIIDAAYEQNKVHTVVEATLPGGKYDFIAKLVGPRQANQGIAINTNWTTQLQYLIRQKFGVVGNLERRATDVLVMKPVNAAPTGFKISHTMPGGFAIKPKP
jgi:RNA polymerase sigma factor (sigma-70 family)